MPFTEKEAGIVDEDVEPAETGDRRRHRRVPLVLAGYVEMQVHGRLARASNGLRGRPPALVQHVADRHLHIGSAPAR